MEGYLYKWTNYISGWKLRYFVFKNNVLFYYISKGDKPKGKIHLSESKITEDPANDLKFEIEMGTSIFYLKAKTISERDMWLKVLKKTNLISDGNEEIVNNDKCDDLDSQNDDNSEKFQRKLNVLRRCTDKTAPDIIKENSEIFFGAVEELPTPKENKIPFNKENHEQIIIEEDTKYKNESIESNKIFEEEKVHYLYYDSNYVNKRKELPTIKKTFTFNVWNVLKDAVGKDLSKFCVPG